MLSIKNNTRTKNKCIKNKSIGQVNEQNVFRKCVQQLYTK